MPQTIPSQPTFRVTQQNFAEEFPGKIHLTCFFELNLILRFTLQSQFVRFVLAWGA